jgi:hypothetical protein
MIRAIHHVNKPVSNSRVAMAIALSAVTVALILWAIVWRSNLVVHQWGVIRSLFAAHFMAISIVTSGEQWFTNEF